MRDDMPVTTISDIERKDRQTAIVGFLRNVAIPPRQEEPSEQSRVARIGETEITLNKQVTSGEYSRKHASDILGAICRKLTNEPVRDTGIGKWFLTKDAAGNPKKVVLIIRTWSETKRTTAESDPSIKPAEEGWTFRYPYALIVSQDTQLLGEIRYSGRAGKPPKMKNPEVCLAFLGKVDGVFTAEQERECLDVLRGRIERFASLNHAREKNKLEKVLALAENARPED